MVQKMSYSNEEKETILRFDYTDNCWYVESSVPSHITKLRKIGEVDVITETENGTPTLVKGKIEKECVLIRNKPQKKKMSDEKRKELAERLKLARQN